MSNYQEIDLSNIKTYSATKRQSKVKVDSIAKPLTAGMSFKKFIDALPSILKAEDLKKVALAVVDAKKQGKPIIAMLGGHVIKTGCSPVLADLAKNGFITHLASNGAAGIHDTELARFGHTSEDVGPQLEDGSFGMAADTAALVNEAAVLAKKEKLGFGESVGKLLINEKSPHIEKALIALAYQQKIPYTLHVALGTDIVHQHPDADGAAIGDASLRDFRIFAHTVSNIGEGGVVLNFGSAVVMPEVFLKALSVSRNLRKDVFNFTTANFDMIQHYRPIINVVNRPVLKGGQGYAISGHHEIMIPLLATMIYEYNQ